MRVVLLTCPSQIAEGMLTHLVTNKLVACGNIISGVKSIYRWLGKIEHSEESVLIMETRKEKVDAMMQAVLALHPYAVPKILTFAPQEFLKSYKDWVIEETNQ